MTLFNDLADKVEKQKMEERIMKRLKRIDKRIGFLLGRTETWKGK